MGAAASADDDISIFAAIRSAMENGLHEEYIA
jgi:hypothetical protein